MTAVGNPIEAVLTLNATSFHTGINDSVKAVERLQSSFSKFEGGVNAFRIALDEIVTKLNDSTTSFSKFETQVKGVESFNKFANGVRSLAIAIQTLGGDSATASVGITKVIQIVESMSSLFGSSTIKVEGLAGAVRQLIQQENQLANATKQSDTVLREAQQDLMGMAKGVEPLARVQKQAEMMKQEFTRSREEMLKFAQYGVNAFNQIDARSDSLKAQISSMNAEFERSKAELMEFARYGLYRFQEVTTGAEKLKTAQKEVATATEQATQSLRRQSTASRTATASTEAQTNATNRLGRAMSSLRMIGTMVASMMVWNFASSLVKATRETVNAKSEMEGYFKMLHFNQGEINQFNKALEQTVGKFQRINKYSLGETISSIGVEFNLTTKEMEKAMPVVSMITSEYLRAGRNVNEASLAVKDILQGEFQRLSRETGVKGDQLKEAGWSGDKKDVMGLLEALDTVGKSRNWDVFVTKANSLNDAVLILQNRFGEWSADMVNVVQPSILFVFNTLMSVGGLFGQVMERVWAWFNGDGLVNQAVKWTSLATAIGLVSTALIHYRTGANLVQIAQMGLRGSIMATIFGLKAEEVATYGTRNAIISKLTSLKAEQVATLGVRKAILSKVLGLKAEVVATMGLRNALGEEVVARRLQEAQLKGATVQQKMAIYTEYEEQMAKRGTLRAIIGKVAGVNMETFAEKGLIVALAERIASSPLYIGSLKAEEIAELSTAEAGFILMGSLLPLVAIIGGIAVALYGLIKPLQDASAEMKAFNTLNQDGDNIIKANKKTVESYTSRLASQKEKLGELTEGTTEYKKQLDKVNATQKTLDYATKKYENSIKAVEMVRSRQAKFEEERGNIALEYESKLADAYVKSGISSAKAIEYASTEMAEAEKGAEQLRKALQMIKYEAERGGEDSTKVIDMLDKYGLSEEKVKQYGRNMAEANKHIREGMERFMTSDDLMDRIGGWFEIQQGRLEEWWTEFNAFWEVRDWKGMGDKIQEGLWYVFDSISLGKPLKALYESIQEKGLVDTVMEALFGEGDSDGTVDIISQWANECIVQPIQSWMNWFMEDPSAHFVEMRGDMASAIGKFLFGKDADEDTIHTMVEEWFVATFIKPVQDGIDGFLADPLSWFNETQGGIGGFSAIWNILFGSDATISSVLNEKVNYIIDNFGQILHDAILRIPLVGSLVSLFDTLTDENIGATEIGGKIGDWLGNGLNEAVNRIPILGQVKQLLEAVTGDESEVTSKGEQVGSNLTMGIQTGIAPLDGIINNAFNLDGLTSNFTSSTSTITSNASSTASQVSTSFTNMKNNQKLSLDSMSSNNRTAFDDMKNKNNTSLLHMRDTTSQTTSQVSKNFTSMKDSILKSSSQIKTDSSNDFTSLGQVIHQFYENIKNPSNWGSIGGFANSGVTRHGAGNPSWSRQAKPLRVRKALGLHGAGIDPYSSSSSKTMSIKDLMKMVNVDEKVPIDKFLSMFSGGFGGWDYSSNHRTYIKNKAYDWDTAPATIDGIGQVGHGYKVDRWKNGNASFNWSDFTATAESIFSVIPYKFYYDSEWKGNWVSALLSGAVNCSDGADALIALARVFGFDGYKQHTTLANGIGHFFAVINGRSMDTTAFQKGRGWSPLGGAGIPTRTAYNNRGSVGNSTTHNITINVNGDVYGEEDFISRIRDGAREVMREEFNDSLTGVM